MKRYAAAALTVLCIALLGSSPTPAPARDAAPDGLRIATYNIENMMMLFDQHRMPERSRNRTEMFRDEEDLFEIAAVTALPDMDADIICIQESCDEAMLRLFNERWLHGRYAMVRAFRGNTDGQFLAMLARPGLEVLDVREYFEDLDSQPGLTDDNNDAPARLFNRGPAFVKFRDEAGRVFWVGTVHLKSKWNDSPAAARWRVRMMARLRDICHELAADAPMVAVAGDFNDSFGQDRIEREIDTDAITHMLTPVDDRTLHSVTRGLAADNPQLGTWHGAIKPSAPSFIDHIFMTTHMAEHVTDVWVVQNPIALVASDHLPVVVQLDWR